MTPLSLPAKLGDLQAVEETNRRLRERAVVLDWSAVEEAPPEVLSVLLSGISLDEYADELGLDTIPEALSAAIELATSQPARKAVRKTAAEPETAGSTPAIWVAGEEPEAGTDLRGPEDW